MEEMSGLHRVYQGEYTVYQREAVYCFIKSVLEQTELTLEEGFAKGGQFLFCPARLEDKSAAAFFIRNGMEYLKRWNRKLLFLWIENPEEAFYHWRLSLLERTARTQDLVFGGYRFRMGAWERLEVQEDDFVFFYPQPGGYSFGSMDQILSGNTSGLRLKTTGELCGAFCGELFLGEADADGIMEKLDAGIRYFRVMDSQEPEAAANAYLSQAVNRVLFPKGDLTIGFVLTPQCLSDAKRTRLGLSKNTFLTHFATTMGRAVKVEADADAALVFQECPVFTYEDERGDLCARKRLYLGIEGGFRIAEEEIRLLCGTSGTENILLKTGGSIRFQSAMPSVAPYKETALGTTSWVGYSKDAVYYCQPQDNAFYAAMSDAGLRFLEVPAANFGKGLPAVPMIPFRGIDVKQEEIPLLEKSLYSRRREILSANDDNVYKLFLSKSARAVTPQGVMAEVTPDGNYHWIGFASLSEEEELPQMRFTQVDATLKQKLQQKELLYVIESAQEFEKVMPSEGFAFSIDGIRFSMLPDAWRSSVDSQTVMIFQYSATKCMKDALPEHALLQNAIQNAYSKTGEVQDGYEALVDAVSDKAFQGLLALNVSVLVEDMPPEVEFLLTGIDKERFFASYLIVSAGKISVSASGGLRLSGSKVSGLAEYKAEDKLVYKDMPPDYEYLVRELRIQIKESHLVSFMSSSELLLNRLFEAKAVSNDNSDGNCLVLQGRLVEKDGKRTYQFHLKQGVAYCLDGSAISDVWIQRVDLVTDEALSGSFLLSGVLSCQNIEGADLFGFGGMDVQEGLPFSQLVLVMEKPECDAASTAFTMKYDTLNFDRERIVLRENSFPERFAVCLESFFAERAGETPQKKGYTPVTAPISQGIPPEAYQGFVWKINVGSLGELSGQSSIQLQLMTAFWGGEQGEVQYFAGIKLPELLSGDKLKLQGIFKLGFGSVSLEKEDDEYRVRLHNFHLEILGASFPGGDSDIFLFSDGEHIGWYAVYEGDGNG